MLSCFLSTPLARTHARTQRHASVSLAYTGSKHTRAHHAPPNPSCNGYFLAGRDCRGSLGNKRMNKMKGSVGAKKKSEQQRTRCDGVGTSAARHRNTYRLSAQRLERTNERIVMVLKFADSSHVHLSYRLCAHRLERTAAPPKTTAGYTTERRTYDQRAATVARDHKTERQHKKDQLIVGRRVGMGARLLSTIGGCTSRRLRARRQHHYI